MSETDPAAAAEALEAAEAARKSTLEAAEPAGPAGEIALFITQAVTLTLFWWLVARRSVTGWIAALAIVALVGVTLTVIGNRNPRALQRRDGSIEAPHTRSFESTAITALTVVPGIWLTYSDRSIWFFGLVVTVATLLSIPLVRRLRRKTYALPV